MPIWEDERVRRGMQRLLAVRDEREAGGARRLGWKAGLAGPAAMARLGTDGALVAPLMADTLHASGDYVPVDGWTDPQVEPELAIRLGATLPGGASRAEVAAAIVAVAPAFELVDQHLDPVDPEEVIGCGIFHRAVVLGDWDEGRAGARIDDLVLDVLVDDQPVAEGVRAAEAVDVVAVARHVADVAAAFGEELRAGDLVITGTLVPPLAGQAGKRYESRLAGLGTVSATL